MGSSHGTSCNKPLVHRVELSLGGDTTNMKFDQTHTDTHEHAASTHRHTNTQLQKTDSKMHLQDTCLHGHTTHACESRQPHLTTHAQHNTYPPIALLPPPFSRIPNPSNMSQKHGAGQRCCQSAVPADVSPRRFMNSLSLRVGLGDPGLRTSAPRCLLVARDHLQGSNLGSLLRGARRHHLCQNALLWEAVTCRRSSRKSLCSATRQR